MKRTLALLLFASTSVAAQTPAAEVVVTADEPARDYADGSVSFIGSASLGVGLFSAPQQGSSFQTVTLTGGFAVRFVSKLGLVFEPRVGADGLLTTGAAGLYAVFAVRAGLGIGWALRISQRLALTPMVAYEAQLVAGGVAGGLGGVMHTGALELPLTVFFSRSGFVEVYVRGGASTALGSVVPTFAAGYRFGVLW